MNCVITLLQILAQLLWQLFHQTVNGDEFDLTFQIHFPHLLYCDRKIEVAGTLEVLESLGYSFAPGFAPLIEQRYRVVA
jgi:hypothetical protein